MYDGAFKSVTDQCDYIRQNLCSDKCELSLGTVLRTIQLIATFSSKHLHIDWDSKVINFKL